MSTLSYQNSYSPGSALLEDADGNFYGTTQAGVFFRLTPAGDLTTLATLSATSPPLIQVGGNFYGILYNGEDQAFELTPDGVLTDLAVITVGEDSWASGLTPGSDGNFYGATAGGGANNLGEVFQLTPSGTVTSIVSFDSSIVPQSVYHTVSPLLLASDGNFYGTAYQAGTNSMGAIYRVSPSGSLSLLASFNGSGNGSLPLTGMVQGADGNLYGVTSGGGVSYLGVFYQLTLAGDLNPLYDFGTANGRPNGPLLQGADGNFYGTSGQTSGSGNGTIFSLTAGGSLTTLLAFNGSNGSQPAAGLMLGSDGNYYGTTTAGGGTVGANAGTIFRLTQPPAAPTGLTAVAGSGSVTLSWNVVSGAASYNVYQGTIAGGEGTAPAASVLSTGAIVSGLTAGQTCYFTVTAVSANGESAFSNEASATVAASSSSSSSSGGSGGSGGGGGVIGWPALLFLGLALIGRRRMRVHRLRPRTG